MTTKTRLKLINEILEKGEYFKLVELKNDLEEQLRVETSKEKGQVNLYKFITSFISKIDKNNLDKFNGLKHEYEKFYLCDGYRAFEFIENIEGIQEIQSNINFTDLFKGSKDNAKIKLEIKNDELKFMCEKQKAIDKKSPVIIKQDDKKYGFNPSYMLDILKIVKDPEIYISGNPYSPFFIKGNINSILLPVKVNQ